MRPWQHVLDALAGYLLLAERLVAEPAPHATAWNFGPDQDTAWTAARVADTAALRFGQGAWRHVASDLAIEVPALLLDSERAQHRLGWRPRLATAEAVAWAVDGYRALLQDGDTRWLYRQIEAYEERPPAAAVTPSLTEGVHAFA